MMIAAGCDEEEPSAVVTDGSDESDAGVDPGAGATPGGEDAVTRQDAGASDDEGADGMQADDAGDAHAIDSNALQDAGSNGDASTTDAGPRDAEPPDARALDVETPDGNGASDANESDAASPADGGSLPVTPPGCFRGDPSAEVACIVGPVPAGLGFDPFYQKHCDVLGIPIVSSPLVPDDALRVAAGIVGLMLGGRADLRNAMIAANGRVGIMAAAEVTTDIPEHAFLANDPQTNWDERARGLGGTPQIPITTGAEENILCQNGDRYVGESVLLHELSHAIHLISLNAVDPSFEPSLMSAYSNAVQSNLWTQTYAIASDAEYWAEGVQSFFDANLESSPPNGIHNEIDTPAELSTYDPTLYNLIDSVF